MKNKFLTLARNEIVNLEAYTPAIRDAKIIVNANENNWGLAESVLEDICKAVRGANRYPDSTNTRLREILASNFHLCPENFIVSNGLDGFFTMFCRAFLSPDDNIIVSDCTFSVYATNAKISGSSVITVPLREDYSQNLDDFYNAIKPNTKAIFYCNPNNPTGLAVSLGEIEKFLGKLPNNIFFILDEAYIEFSDLPQAESFKLLEKFDNLVICRTCSKICALAGLRIGYSAMHPDLANVISLVRETYCVSQIAEVAACSFFSQPDLIEKIREDVREGRNMLERALRSKGIKFLPSCTNFVYIMPNDKEAKILHSVFDEHSIAVRFFGSSGQESVRVTIGTQDEMKKIVEAIREA